MAQAARGRPVLDAVVAVRYPVASAADCLVVGRSTANRNSQVGHRKERSQVAAILETNGGPRISSELGRSDFRGTPLRPNSTTTVRGLPALDPLARGW